MILNIHGGAFQAGDKDKVLPLVASGKFAAVSINYRLSGQAIWSSPTFLRSRRRLDSRAGLPPVTGIPNPASSD